MLRQTLLKISKNAWLRKHATSSRVLRRSVRRFVPGESLDDALAACGDLAQAKIAAVLTYLGESVVEHQAALLLTNNYLKVLEPVSQSGISSQIPVKLTPLSSVLRKNFCLPTIFKTP